MDMSIIKQAICTLIVCYGCLSLGLMYTWPSSTIRLFAAATTPLDRPMTETEISLFGSLSSISALVCTPLCGFLLDTLGRKYSCILFSLPQVIAWAIVCVSVKVEAVLAAMFISGLGGCIILIAPVFISEFCQESIRGRMTSSCIISYGIGMLVSYVLGGYLEYHTTTYICLSLCAVGTALLALLADSPTYLMKKGSEKEAARAIAFYRAAKVNSKEVMEEISTIRRSLNPEMDDETPEAEQLKPDFKPKEKLSFFKFMKKSRSSRQAFALTLILYFATMFQGLIAIQVYAEPLFSEAVPTMSPTVSSVIFAVVTVVAGLTSAYMIDVAGRRPLMIYSSMCAGVCCIALGSQIQCHWGPHWLTAAFIYLFCIAYSLGAGTVPYVVAAEVFLPEIRSLTSTLAMEWAWTCNFILLFIFNPLVTALGLGGVFYVFSAMCFFSAVYSYFYLPETSGLTVDVIQTLFKNPRRKPTQ